LLQEVLFGLQEFQQYKMKKRVLTLIFLASLLVLTTIIFSTSYVSAENNVCCEKLTADLGGAWCQNAPIASCDTGINSKTGQKYNTAPTSCESTQFCSTGTCFDSQEGICEEGVAQNVCNSGGGVWSEKSASELPQCGLGCCLLGEGASFVTQSRCKQLSSLYGVETNFNSGVSSEVQCIASAGGDEKGACVYETGSERTCKLLTKTGCNGITGEFFEGILCSDENLGTNCGPSEKTTMVEGQSEVYFVDTCANLANIYDSSKIKDKDYWSRIIPKEESCGYGSSNADSPICGNCDYYRGSTASAYKRGETAKPQYGDFICKDLGCTSNGVKYEHGESWCGLAPGTANITDQNNSGSYLFGGKTASPDLAKTNLPGSTYTRLSCYNNEITTENCYDARQKVCVQSEINGFKNAACKLNTWQSCYDQKDETSCLDREQRDCKWSPSEEDKKKFTGCDKLGSSVVRGILGNIGAISCLFYYNEPFGNQMSAFKTHGDTGYCTPLNQPGFDFWTGDNNGEGICSLGTVSCQYRTTKSVATGSGVDDGAECINSDNSVKPEWIQAMNYRCMQIGDCGPKLNYIGQPGEMKTIVEKKFGGEQAVGYFVRSDGKEVKVPGPGGTEKTLKFKDFFKF